MSAVALAGVLAGVLAIAAPDVLARFDDGPTPTAQTVFDAIHAKYQFPGQERQDFHFCVPKKYRETWEPDPAETDAPDAYKYDPNECFDAVLTESLDVYEMAGEDEAEELVRYNAPAPGQAEPSNWRWRQSGRFVLAWHGRIEPADPHRLEGMVEIADKIVLGRHRFWPITVVAVAATVALTAMAWAARHHRGRAATAR
ncbi:hypothetical protein KBX37_16295 [Micromonospora sp. U56]|uniref:hypothetical protein n=1 Tax=Micromonospora sp. U56 TaxID=2824900 RepID=UPI001B35CFE0|nr:hypothetical protein [Micromonospora sp. U56]MBQ0894639.1 hypothetical protein [Micromonospora sp. U56]